MTKLLTKLNSLKESQVVFVVESPSKINTAKQILDEIGVRSHGVATFGRLFDFDDDDRYIENVKGVHSFFINLKADVLLCLTDNDNEGELMSSEISKLIPQNVEFYRLRYQALTYEQIKSAFDNHMQIDKEMVNKAITQRVINRFVGYHFFDNKSTHTLPQGTVITPAIAAIRSKQLLTENNPAGTYEHDFGLGELKLMVEFANISKDKLASFSNMVQSLDVKVVQTAVHEEQEKLVPMNFKTALQVIPKSTGMTAEKVANIMQKLYQEGSVSYCRTSNVNLTEADSATIASTHKNPMAALNVLRPKTSIKGADLAHTGIVSHAKQSLLKKKRQYFSEKESVLYCIEQHNHNCAYGGVERELKGVLACNKDSQTLRDLAELHGGSIRVSARSLITPLGQVVADLGTCHYPFERPSNGITLAHIDKPTQILNILIASGIGKPSTIVNHSVKIAKLVNDELNLNGRGKMVFNQAILQHPELLRKDIAHNLQLNIGSIDRVNANPAATVIASLNREFGDVSITQKEVLNRISEAISGANNVGMPVFEPQKNPLKADFQPTRNV